MLEQQMSGRQELPEQLHRIGKQILLLSRNELYLKMRFLDVALSSCPFVLDEGIGTIGTDGLCFYYEPRYLGGLFREDQVLVNRAYLHMVLHGIFKHMAPRGGRDERKVLTAEKIYGELLAMSLSEREIERLEEEFVVDSHLYWPSGEDKKKQEEIENKWQEISEQMETDMETFSKESASSEGDFIAQVKVENREKFDYPQFLRKFSVLREETVVDQDSFDYVFYSYGLSLYGNMPLIEPQEWREVQKIEEFVIVIDTSMSCSGELVKKFLEQTYAVLTESDSFFHKVNIHILQCDDQVQTDVKITCAEELVSYMDSLELFGEGGTDFRPAFAYVEELMRKQEITRLKGLLYFTDGKGIYPQKMPPYETAFLFLEEDYEDVDVPPWAMKLILEEDYEY